MKINRKQFIEEIHNNLRNESYDEYSFSDPAIIAPLGSGEDVSVAIESLHKQITDNVPNILSDKIRKGDIIDLILEHNGITTDYDGINVAYISYNRLFEFFVKNNVINNQEYITVYRVEGDSGNGIYQDLSKKGMPISEYFDFCRTKTPSPMEDGCIQSVFGARKYNPEKYQKEWYFAFDDKNKIKKWFDSEKGLFDFILKNGNPKIAEYKVPLNDTISTDKQTIFKINNSTKIKEYSFDNVDFNLTNEDEKENNKKNKDELNESIKKYIENKTSSNKKSRKRKNKNPNQLELF